MVLPFDPMTLTFSDLHYFVEIPKVGQSSTADRPMHTLWAPSSGSSKLLQGTILHLWCILAARLQSGKFA